MQPAILICPLCGDGVEKLLYRFHLGSERQVIERIKGNNPGWSEKDGSCSRCVDYYHTEVILRKRILPEVGPYFPVKSADDFIILPTGLRLDADPRFTGKGVTICFIDSGFYPHPDLVNQGNRIKAMLDITRKSEPIDISNIDLTGMNQAWHGTMVSVVCAGDGYLGNGLYKGIASDVELILLKVQDNKGNISRQNIVLAMKWVLANHQQYGIRIVNMSVGDNEVISFHHSEIDQLAEELTRQGITVVAAVGNDESAGIKPPANSPSVITVGGIDDENRLMEIKKPYHSSYGRTVDALMKPELTAPAIWVAAPILPQSDEQHEAAILYELLSEPNNPDNEKYRLASLPFPFATSSASGNSDPLLAIRNRIRACKYISPYYMHVDGTSFAAPIVCSVIAQMLEANPLLTPESIRDILFSTAKRIKDFPAERQGFGMLQPRKALLKVLKREMIHKPNVSPAINQQQRVIDFYIQHDCANTISLSGSFIDWNEDTLQLEPGRNGVWKITIPLLAPGRYPYKFLIDEKHWVEDTGNSFSEPDGFMGFNSILIIEN